MRHALFLLGTFLLLAQPAWGQEKPRFEITGENTRPVEGDADHVVQIHWQFSSAPTSEVRFTVRTDETAFPTATPGEDYVIIAPTEVVVPAGQQTGTTPVTIKGDTVVESVEIFYMTFYDFSGGGISGNTGGNGEDEAAIVIFDDDTAPQPPLIGNDDHVAFVIDEAVTFFPGENDAHDPWNVLADTVLTVLQAPANGALTQIDRGSGFDYFSYQPDPDFAGLDQFRYQLCTQDGLECVEATVYLRGQLREPPQAIPSGRSAGFGLPLGTLPPIADVRFAVSTLAHPRREVFQTDVDSTPHLAWDSRDGTAWTTGILPASPGGATTEHRVFIRSLATDYEAVDLRIGVDLDGDGMPSAGEQACLSVGIYGVIPECLLTVDVGADPVRYWVSVHSREEAPYTPAVNVFEMRMDDPESLLRVTGPGSIVRGSMDTWVSWTDPSAIGPLAAFVAVMDGDTRVGEFQLALNGGEGTVLLPVDGSPVWLDLYPNSMKWWEERGLYFDVPPGADAITLTMGADVPISFAPHWFGFEERSVSRVHESGSSEPDSSYVQVAAGQTRTITVQSPQQGRWYALVRNGADARARVKVQVDVQATMPAIRPGSYYNPAQSGHGLLLYPAGNQWAGLWYTYNEYGQPTWYYLQAPKPGADGIWRAPVLRSAWNGTTSTHTEVGVMQITPQDDQRFFMSYMVKGYAGSQVLEALGTGCPMRNGTPLDISSHWFDPARAGNGYSVQTWEDGYQFIAAFTYDSRGNPLFLAAERAGLGGDVADLELQVLRGSCPTNCDYSTPTRTPAGVLRRILSGGGLAEISLDVDFTAPWTYGGRLTFSATDRVQLLGGPGTTQGCAP